MYARILLKSAPCAEGFALCAFIYTINYWNINLFDIILSECYDGDLRLVGGRNATEGRLEFCYGGVWGTVCRDRWGQLDASVACSQLGFSSAGDLFIHGLGVI